MKPILQALVLAERIYEDKSGRKIIAGTFNQISFGQNVAKQVEMPDGTKRQVISGGTDPGSPSAYISMTDVVEGTEIFLQCLNVSKNTEVFHINFRIDKADRLSTVEIVAPLPPISQFLKEAGTFSLDVVWKGEILGSHRIRVVDLSKSGQPGQPPGQPG
jgi:hypothetical protein